MFAGDLVDRGPMSRQVVNFVMEGGYKAVLGNHEDMMATDILNNETPYTGEWLAYQGKETLDSYKGYAEVMREHSMFFRKLPLFLEFEDVTIPPTDDNHGRERHLVVSHASIGSTWKFRDPSSDKYHFFKDKAVWNRDPPDDVSNVYNVHGHTPCYMEPKVKSFYANIDTGCCFNRTGYGKLTAIHIPSMVLIQQENIDSKFREL